MFYRFTGESSVQIYQQNLVKYRRKNGESPVKLFHCSPVNCQCGEFFQFPTLILSYTRFKKISTLNLPALALVLNLDLILAGFGRGRRKILLLPDEIVLKGLRSFAAAAGPPLLMKEGGNE